MTTRTYADRCGGARALDLVGERWALLVVRELLLGPKRFTDLRSGLPTVGPDALSQRLRPPAAPPPRRCLAASRCGPAATIATRWCSLSAVSAASRHSRPATPASAPMR